MTYEKQERELIERNVKNNSENHLISYYSKPRISRTNWGEGQSELSENPSYPRDFFYFVHLLPLTVKIICVMHYVNMFYIYGTHTHTWSRTYAACTYTHVEHVHTDVHWKRTSYASVKNSSGRLGEILGAFTDGSSLLGMVGGGTCTWVAKGSVTALLKRRKARKR